MRSSLLVTDPTDNTTLDLAPVEVLDPGCDAPIQQWPENPGPGVPEGVPVYHYDRQTGEYVKTNYIPDIRTSYIKGYNELPGKTFASLDPPTLERWSEDDVIEVYPDTDDDNVFIRAAREGGYIPSPMDRYVHSQIYRPVQESDLGERVEVSNDAKDWHARTLDKIKIRQGNKGYHRLACFTRCESRQTVDADGNPTNEPTKYKHWQYARVYIGKPRNVEGPQAGSTAEIGVFRDDAGMNNLTREQVEALLVDHAAWLPAHEGKRLTLSRCRIEGLDLTGRDFSQAFFHEVVFTHCILTDCKFAGVFTDRLYFHDCEMEGTDFHSARIPEVCFANCHMKGSHFCDAEMHKVYIHHSDLRESLFTRADINGAIFYEADLSKAIGLPKIAPMPTLAGMLHTGLSLDPDRLNTSYGHFPDRMTISEWACMLHPQGELLETVLGSGTAASLIWNATYGECPDLEAREPEAVLEWLRVKAHSQCRFRVCKIDDKGEIVSPVFDTDWLPSAVEMVNELKDGDGITAGVFCVKTGCRVVDGKLRDDLPGNGGKPLSPWIKASQLEF